MKRPQAFSIAIERGKDGLSLAWCLEMPGCASLIAAGSDPLMASHAAIAEFISWSHQRSAVHADVEAGLVTVAQVFETGADLAGGESLAFFLHDGHAAKGSEFPAWANSHDLALDQLRVLTAELPPTALVTPGGDILHAATRYELRLAEKLNGKTFQPRAGLAGLNDAHSWLQQVICDVPPGLRVRRPAEGRLTEEEWSVRKAMRLSTWHLRYQTAVLRASINRIWLG